MTTPTPKRFVVGLDQSDKDAAALRWAMDMAALADARVEILLALGPLESSHRTHPAADAPSPYERADRHAHEIMERVAPGTEPCTVDVSIRSGDPVLVLLAEIESTMPDLVVLGRRARGVGAPVLGSVSSEIAARSAVPVVVIPRHT